MARLTQIDYAREMAFVAVATEGEGTECQPQTLGVVRAVADPDTIDAEFGITVRSDLKGGGLGELLMRKMISYLRTLGTRRLVATVLPVARMIVRMVAEQKAEVMASASPTQWPLSMPWEVISAAPHSARIVALQV